MASFNLGMKEEMHQFCDKISQGVDFADQQGSVELGILERPKQFFATDRKPQKILSKSKILKNTLQRYNSGQ